MRGWPTAWPSRSRASLIAAPFYRSRASSDAPPLVSVVIPAHNRPRYLVRCLRSLARQTFRDFEAVLIDDGSRPPLYGALRRSSLKRWKYVHRPDNRGPAFSRNEGLRLASGRLIAFLDSDDVWYPRKLEVQSAQFRDPRVFFVHSNVDQIDGAGKRTLRNVIRRRDRDPRTGHPRSLPYTSTIVARRELFEKIGGFDARFRYYYDDSDLWCRVRKAFPGGVRYLDRALAAYRFPAARNGSAETFSLGEPARRLPPRIREYMLDQALFTLKRKRAADPLALAKYRHGRHAE